MSLTFVVVRDELQEEITSGVFCIRVQFDRIVSVPSEYHSLEILCLNERQ